MADDKKKPETETTGPPHSKLGPIPLDHFSNDVPSTTDLVDPAFHDEITEMIDNELKKAPKK